MISVASMTKRVPATGTLGVLSDGTPSLFRRHDSPDTSDTSKYRGFASFSDGGRRLACALLEVADTPELRERGLMGRDSLPGCCGMLFKDLEGGAFWMKGCKIPLDIVFLDSSGRVSRKYGMKVDGGVRRYHYGDERTAIELPYGFCDAYGIEVGTRCKWRDW